MSSAKLLVSFGYVGKMGNNSKFKFWDFRFTDGNTEVWR